MFDLKLVAIIRPPLNRWPLGKAHSSFILEPVYTKQIKRKQKEANPERSLTPRTMLKIVCRNTIPSLCTSGGGELLLAKQSGNNITHVCLLQFVVPTSVTLYAEKHEGLNHTLKSEAHVDKSFHEV